MNRKWIWFVLLILSFTFGVAFTAFAQTFSKAGTVIEQGKIINKEYKWYDDDDGKNVYYWELIVAYNNAVYRCTINKKRFDVECFGYTDRGAFAPD